MIKLNRIQLFLTGVLIFLLFLGLNKYNYWKKSKLIMGTVKTGLRLSKKEVHYKVNGENFIIHSRMISDKGYGDQVPIIYSPKDPSDSYIYSFMGFWVNGLFFLIIPLYVWAAFIFSFLDKKSTLEISIPFIAKKPKSTQKMLEE